MGFWTEAKMTAAVLGLFLSVLNIAPVFGADANADTGAGAEATVMKVQVSVRATKNRFSVGSNPVFKITLKNLGNTNILVSDTKQMFSWVYTFENRKTKKKWRSFLSVPIAAPATDATILKPGKKMTFKTKLSKLHRFREVVKVAKKAGAVGKPTPQAGGGQADKKAGKAPREVYRLPEGKYRLTVSIPTKIAGATEDAATTSAEILGMSPSFRISDKKKKRRESRTGLSTGNGGVSFGGF